MAIRDIYAAVLLSKLEHVSFPCFLKFIKNRQENVWNLYGYPNPGNSKFAVADLPDQFW